MTEHLGIWEVLFVAYTILVTFEFFMLIFAIKQMERESDELRESIEEIRKDTHNLRDDVRLIKLFK